jgi:hypothetical protein
MGGVPSVRARQAQSCERCYTSRDTERVNLGAHGQVRLCAGCRSEVETTIEI